MKKAKEKSKPKKVTLSDYLKMKEEFKEHPFLRKGVRA